MLGSNRPSLVFVGAPIVVAFAICAACSSSSSKAGGAGVDASAHGDARKIDDAGHDAKTKPVDAAPGCGRCDAHGAPDPDASNGSSHDTGHDAGATVHTTGVSIAVTTANGTVNRTYDITVPVQCDAASPLPLVFAFHGGGGSGAGMYASFPIEQAAAAAGQRAIFVYPDGTDANIDPGGVARAWDLYHDPGPYPYTYTPGHAVPAVSDEASGNVDVDFFDTMVESFEQKYCVDPSKVFITGMSSGGYLSNQFARWRSGIVKGTAPQSGAAPFGNNDGVVDGASDWGAPNYCVQTTGQVPTLIIHGSSDGTVDVCNALEAQSYWELANACSGSASNCTMTSDTCTGSNLADPSTAPTSASSLNPLCVETSGCSAPVVFCEIPGMGHSIWPDAPQVIWSFFSSL
jgi:polyhydroxybutyrate depolymerase